MSESDNRILPIEIDHDRGHIDDIGAAGQDELPLDPGALLGGTVDPSEQANEPAPVNAEPGLEWVGKYSGEGGDEGKRDRESGADRQGLPERPLAREEPVPGNTNRCLPQF